MNASPDRDGGPSPVPQWGAVRDLTGEPTGYGLGDPPTYEQPPLPTRRPYREPGPAPADPALVGTGFAAALMGLLASPVIWQYTLFLCAVGTLVSAVTLVQHRRAHSRAPRLAIAGLIMGIAGIVVGAILATLAFGAPGPS